MKNQALFSSIDKSKKIKMSSAAIFALTLKCQNVNQYKNYDMSDTEIFQV